MSFGASGSSRSVCPEQTRDDHDQSSARHDIPTQSIAPLSVVKPKTTLAPMIPAPAAASVSPACFSPLGAIGISFPKPPASWWTTASGASKGDGPAADRTSGCTSAWGVGGGGEACIQRWGVEGGVLLSVRSGGGGRWSAWRDRAWGRSGSQRCVDQACTNVAVVLGAALIVPHSLRFRVGTARVFRVCLSATAVGLEVSTKGGGDVREGAPCEGRFRGRRAHGADPRRGAGLRSR